MEHKTLLRSELSYQEEEYFEPPPKTLQDVKYRKKQFLMKCAIFVLAILCSVFLIASYIEEAIPKDKDVLEEWEGRPLNDTVLPPFQNTYHEYIVSPRLGLSHCLLPKVMSTISTATICYLDNPLAFKKANRVITEEMYQTRFCPQLEKKSFAEVKPYLKNITNNIILIRNPYERFISGYMSKCFYKNLDVCHGCKSDMRCFLQKEFVRLKNITQQPVNSVADTHFAPQTWHCEMEENMKTSTIIRYGSSFLERERMITEYINVFRKNNVSEEDIEEIRKELSKGKSVNTTKGSTLRQKYEKLVREDKAVRRAIQRFYYYDFLIFGFDM